MAINDSVDWRAELGGGTRVALIQAGTFRSDAGTLFGPVPWVLWGDLVTDEIDDEAPPPPGAELPADRDAVGRVLVETGIGDRLDDKTRDMRGYEGPWIVPALESAGFLPDSVNVVAMSHLHFDHAGGLLRADGERAFPFATIVAQRAEWEVALADNPRLVASYVQPELGARRDWGAEGWVDGERELLPGVTVVPTGGHSSGHQAIIVRGTGDGARTVAFLGDLFMRPWGANPRWVTSFDDLPLDSVVRKVELFEQAVDEDWPIVLSHEARCPSALVRDRDRFRFEGLEPRLRVEQGRRRAGRCRSAPAPARLRRRPLLRGCATPALARLRHTRPVSPSMVVPGTCSDLASRARRERPEASERRIRGRAASCQAR